MKTNFLFALTTFILFLGSVHAQSWQWAMHAGGLENDNAHGIDVDKFGNSYVTGTFYDSASFGSTTLVNPGSWTVYLAKYDMNGSLLWAKIAAKDSAISVSGISLDSMGNISIVGQFFGTATFGSTMSLPLVSAGSFDVFVAKYTPSGDIIWVNSLGYIGMDDAGGISNDNVGNVFLTGSFHVTSFPYSSSKIFLAKFDSVGNNSWLRTEMDYGLSHFGNGIKTDSVGNSYLTGDFFNTIKFSASDSIDAGNIESNIFLAKFDSTGEFLWGSKAGGSSGYCVSKAIDADASGNTYITGFYHGTISFGPLSITSTSGLAYDVCIAKCDAYGNFEWTNKSIGACSSSNISLDNSGNVFLCGNFTQSISFGLNTLTSRGNNDVFITELDPTGNFVWATSCGGLQNDFSGGLKVGSDGIYLTGYFEDTIYFGNTLSLVSNSALHSDIFIAKLNNVTGIEKLFKNEKLSIFPNPTSGQFTLSLSTDNAEIFITNLFGQQILERGATQKTMNLQIEKSGVYIVSEKSKNGITTGKLIVNHK